MKKMNKKGFTIVELVIVITVIAILSAVMIPTFTGVVKNAKNSAAAQEARSAYTNYLYENQDTENTDFIYEYEENAFIAINDGTLVDADADGKVDVYSTRALALKAINENYVEGQGATCEVTATSDAKLSTVVSK